MEGRKAGARGREERDNRIGDPIRLGLNHVSRFFRLRAKITPPLEPPKDSSGDRRSTRAYVHRWNLGTRRAVFRRQYRPKAMSLSLTGGAEI